MFLQNLLLINASEILFPLVTCTIISDYDAAVFRKETESSCYNVSVKKRSYKSFASIAILCMLSLSTGCGGGKSLRVQGVQEGTQLTGQYRLVLYRDGSWDGLKTVAFLDLEGDGYMLVPHAERYDYQVVTGVRGQDALREALAFIRSHRLYRGYQMSSILDPSGNIIGYEVRPLYDPTTYGVSDLLTVSYTLREEGKVQIDITLLQRVINRDQR